MEVAGPSVGGIITRDDLAAPSSSPVRPLVEIAAGEHSVLVPPDDLPARFPPPPVAPVPVGAALCADMHGVIACALWAIAPEAIALADDTGLSLAALSNPPTKGVTRRKPGSPLPMPVPAAIVQTEGRAWGGLATPGEGAVEWVRDAHLRARLETAGIHLADRAVERSGSARGLSLWVLREFGGDVRATSEAFSRE
jgi:hypothetical protein